MWAHREFQRAAFGVAILAGAVAARQAPAVATAGNPFADARVPTRLLVVAPASFEPVLAPFVAHKRRTGMSAFLVSIETLREACAGADDAERLKRGIELAHRKLRTEFVMLVGDASLLPVRFRQVQQVDPQANLDGTYNPSELYFANLYRDHAPGAKRDDPEDIRDSGRFDTWDGDGDGAFDEQHWKDDAVSYNPDRVDGCPDVALGRLPAHTLEEARTYVERVVRYETQDSDPAWGRRIAFVADRNYGGGTNHCDSILGGATVGARTLARDEDVERLILNHGPAEPVDPPWTKGTFERLEAALASSWWTTYVGHAGPRSWALFEADHAFDEARVRLLANRAHHPIVFAIGCESGMFAEWQPRGRYRDVQGELHEFAWNAEKRHWTDRAAERELGARLVVPQPGGYDLPEAGDRTFACAWLLSSSGGGAIAYFGETLVCENDKGSELLTAMFRRLVAGDRTLGEVWRNGQRAYWLANRASENVLRSPRIYLGIMTFFGDPSLRLRERAPR